MDLASYSDWNYSTWKKDGKSVTMHCIPTVTVSAVVCYYSVCKCNAILRLRDTDDVIRAIKY